MYTYIVMAEHHSFWHACGSWCVDKHTTLVDFLTTNDVIKGFVWNLQAQTHELVPLPRNRPVISFRYNHHIDMGRICPLTYWKQIRQFLQQGSRILHNGFQMWQFIFYLWTKLGINVKGLYEHTTWKGLSYYSTCKILSSCFWFSTTIIFALESLATWQQASGEFVVYIPVIMPLMQLHTINKWIHTWLWNHLFRSMFVSHPAKTAPTAEKNHSAELNPKMATLWKRSSPNYRMHETIISSIHNSNSPRTVSDVDNNIYTVHTHKKTNALLNVTFRKLLAAMRQHW